MVLRCGAVTTIFDISRQVCTFVSGKLMTAAKCTFQGTLEHLIFDTQISEFLWQSMNVWESHNVDRYAMIATNLDSSQPATYHVFCIFSQIQLATLFI